MRTNDRIEKLEKELIRVRNDIRTLQDQAYLKGYRLGLNYMPDTFSPSLRHVMRALLNYLGVEIVEIPAQAERIEFRPIEKRKP